MRVLVDFPWANAAAWLTELRRQAPALDLQIWPDLVAPQSIDAAVVWTPAADLFRGMDRLKAIIVPGAGVDQLWRNLASLPDVPIIRLVDPVMARRMAEYILAMVLDHHRQLGLYREQQAGRTWIRHHHRDPGDIGVGIMGLGVMGLAAAGRLAGLGYDVSGWSRRARAAAGLDTVAGNEAFRAFLERSDVLVCLLPLTVATRGILNAATFEALPDGALVINAARGGHLAVPDLLAALDRGKLGSAVLDVFEDEPLPADSPLWRHPKITLTPHIAALSDPVSGARQIVEALAKLAAGEAPDHVVDPSTGY